MQCNPSWDTKFDARWAFAAWIFLCETPSRDKCVQLVSLQSSAEIFSTASAILLKRNLCDDRLVCWQCCRMLPWIQPATTLSAIPSIQWCRLNPVLTVVTKTLTTSWSLWTGIRKDSLDTLVLSSVWPAGSWSMWPQVVVSEGSSVLLVLNCRLHGRSAAGFRMGWAAKNEPHQHVAKRRVCPVVRDWDEHVPSKILLWYFKMKMEGLGPRIRLFLTRHFVLLRPEVSKHSRNLCDPFEDESLFLLEPKSAREWTCLNILDLGALEIHCSAQCPQDFCQITETQDTQGMWSHERQNPCPCISEACWMISAACGFTWQNYWWTKEVRHHDFICDLVRAILKYHSFLKGFLNPLVALKGDIKGNKCTGSVAECFREFSRSQGVVSDIVAACQCFSWEQQWKTRHDLAQTGYRNSGAFRASLLSTSKRAAFAKWPWQLLSYCAMQSFLRHKIWRKLSICNLDLSVWDSLPWQVRSACYLAILSRNLLDSFCHLIEKKPVWWQIGLVSVCFP